jgi:hypothetical protein
VAGEDLIFRAGCSLQHGWSSQGSASKKKHETCSLHFDREL